MRRLGRYLRAIGVGLCLVAILAIPAVALLLLLRPIDPPEVVSRIEPVTAPVLSSEVFEEVDVALTVRRTDVVTVALPSVASGTVTRVLIRTGDAVSDGTPLLAIDGVERRALASIFPPWRDLKQGDVGVDVAELQAFLARTLATDLEASGIFDTATRRATEAFASSIGVARPDGRFQRSWVVWLPSSTLLVGEIDAVAGRDAPQGGAPIFRSAATITAIDVRPAAATTGVDIEAFEVSVGSEAVGTVLNGQIAPSSAGPTLDELAALLDQATTGDGTDTDTSKATSAAVARSIAGRRSQGIAASAVQEGASGSTCVWVRSGTPPTFAPVKVTVIGGTIGRVEIEPDLPDRSEVLVNPAEILDDPTCR